MGEKGHATARPTLLVLRALQLGDLLVAVPALHALRRAFPGHSLLYAAPAWLAEAVALVGGYDLLPTAGIDDPLGIGPGTVDIAVNLHGCGPQSNARVSALGARVTMSHGPGVGDLRWQDGLHQRERWTRLLQWYGIDADPLDVELNMPPRPSPVPGATVIHAGAAFASRLWPEERFAEVARRLAGSGHSVVLTGSVAERERALRIAGRAGLPGHAVLAGTQHLSGFAAVVAEARLVVSADTGAAHLASAYHRPSVVMFGPVGPDEWGPPPGPHVVLERPVLRRGDPFAADPDPALLGVSAADVLAAIDSLGLSETGSSRRR